MIGKTIGRCRVVVVLGAVVLAACRVAPSVELAMTDTERREIVETITQLAATVDDKGNGRAECEAKLDLFEGREPVVASHGLTLRTIDDLRPMCPDSVPSPSRFDVAQADVHVLSRETAYIVRQGTMFMMLGTPDETQFLYAVTQIFNRVDGEWKLAHHHESFPDTP